jgi:hypothetical protein
MRRTGKHWAILTLGLAALGYAACSGESMDVAVGGSSGGGASGRAGGAGVSGGANASGSTARSGAGGATSHEQAGRGGAPEMSPGAGEPGAVGTAGARPDAGGGGAGGAAPSSNTGGEAPGGNGGGGEGGEKPAICSADEAGAGGVPSAQKEAKRCLNVAREYIAQCPSPDFTLGGGCLPSACTCSCFQRLCGDCDAFVNCVYDCITFLC